MSRNLFLPKGQKFRKVRLKFHRVIVQLRLNRCFKLRKTKLKIRRNCFVAIVCICALLLVPAESMAAKKKSKKRYILSARSAVLMDVTKGKRLFGKNADSKVWPASTTKVMTALLVLENLPMDKMVTVSKTATNVQPSKAGLIAGERYRVSDLLYAALMQSANDASMVLAEAVAGSQGAFVNMMNRRARQMGALHTHFENPHGLPTEARQYTSAYDMALILKAALKYPSFKEVLANKNKVIASQEGRPIALKSYNKLLWKNWKKNIFGKTGYTKKARYCFVGYFEKDNRTIIVAVFGCTKQRWNDIRYIVTKYAGVRL